MTEKQEKILNTALHLFATHGYDATSTSKVARQAGVSEGLIFRHFQNKEGLLGAIMQRGKDEAMRYYGDIIESDDPVQVIHGVIKLPFQLDVEVYPFWKLLYALKWQEDVYDDEMSAPIRTALIEAFEALSFRDPEAEADIVLMLLDGIATAILLRNPSHKQEILNALLNKYNL